MSGPEKKRLLERREKVPGRIKTEPAVLAKEYSNWEVDSPKRLAKWGEADKWRKNGGEPSQKLTEWREEKWNRWQMQQRLERLENQLKEEKKRLQKEIKRLDNIEELLRNEQEREANKLYGMEKSEKERMWERDSLILSKNREIFNEKIKKTEEILKALEKTYIKEILTYNLLRNEEIKGVVERGSIEETFGLIEYIKNFNQEKKTESISEDPPKVEPGSAQSTKNASNPQLKMLQKKLEQRENLQKRMEKRQAELEGRLEWTKKNKGPQEVHDVEEELQDFFKDREDNSEGIEKLKEKIKEFNQEKKVESISEDPPKIELGSAQSTKNANNPQLKTLQKKLEQRENLQKRMEKRQAELEGRLEWTKENKGPQEVHDVEEELQDFFKDRENNSEGIEKLKEKIKEFNKEKKAESISEDLPKVEPDSVQSTKNANNPQLKTLQKRLEQRENLQKRMEKRQAELEGRLEWTKENKGPQEVHDVEEELQDFFKDREDNSEGIKKLKEKIKEFNKEKKAESISKDLPKVEPGSVQRMQNAGEDLSAGINKFSPSGKQFSLNSRDGNENEEQQRFNSSLGSPSLLEFQIIKAGNLSQIRRQLTNPEFQIINNAGNSSQEIRSSLMNNSKKTSPSLSGIPSFLKIQIMSIAVRFSKVRHPSANPELQIINNAVHSSQKTHFSSMDNSKQMSSSLSRPQKNFSKK